MSARALVHASEAQVAAAGDALLKKGNAVDAVVAGVLAACALHPGTLLAPVQILIGGAGAGLRAVDGRLRQPGKGIPRPRGFRDEDPIPAAARAAVPTAPGVLAGAAAAFGKATFNQLVAPAVDLAKSCDPERAKVIERLHARGGSLFGDPLIAEPLTAALGRLAGGVLTTEDLDAVVPEIVACEVDIRGSRRFARAPWASESASSSARTVRAIAAADGRGMVALALYETPEDGATVSELGLLAPFYGAPVRRGETRLAPGAFRPLASPAFLSEADGLVDVALSICASAAPEPELDRAMAQLLEGAPVAPPTEIVPGAGYYVGLSRSRTAVQVIADPRR